MNNCGHMVKISYCPNCKKAYRFHFKKKLICRSCKEPFESIEVKRGKYFIIQLPILFTGSMLLFYSVYMFSSISNRIAENLGFLIFGIALVLFALAFQILDSKNMEKLAKDEGLKKYGDIIGKPETARDRHKIKTLDFDKKDGGKYSQVLKVPKKKITADDLFVQPNKPDTLATRRLTTPIHKKYPKNMVKKPSKQISLDVLADNPPEKKRARKIRRAI